MSELCRAGSVSTAGDSSCGSLSEAVSDMSLSTSPVSDHGPPAPTPHRPRTHRLCSRQLSSNPLSAEWQDSSLEEHPPVTVAHTYTFANDNIEPDPFPLHSVSVPVGVEVECGPPGSPYYPPYLYGGEEPSQEQMHNDYNNISSDYGSLPCEGCCHDKASHPTLVNSWGHFSRKQHNRYKYRRSDYSSDSEEELVSRGSQSHSLDSRALGPRKSHLAGRLLQPSLSLGTHHCHPAPDRCFLTLQSEGVRPHIFKERLATMKRWFTDFNDEQKNIVLKGLLKSCDLPQIHMLSVQMTPNLHRGCPPNCEDIVTWLPSSLAARILGYLDPVSLCRASQVCKIWKQLADDPSFWRRFCCQPKWRLSKAAEHKQVISHMSPEGSIQWKEVFAERFRLRNNWLHGRCTVRTFEGHTQGISCVQFDDTRIVSGSSDKTIKVWNIRTNAQWSVQTLVGHSGTVRCLHLEGKRLVSGSSDCTIKVWDLSTQDSWSSIACKVTMIGHSDTVRCLQVDDDKVISGSYDKTLKVWDLRTGACRRTLVGHQGAVLCVHFDDTKIVSGSADKTIKVWSFAGNCVTTLAGHQDAVTCLQFDLTRIISGSLDYNLKFWNIHSGECISTIDWKAAEGHTGVVRCLQADSWRLVSSADDKTIKVWNLETGQRLVTLRNHTDGVTCLQFNDFIIVSGSYDKTVKLWDFSCC